MLLRDDYCDGLGDCLPACPMNAISFVEREAAAYDEKAVLANLEEKRKKAPAELSFSKKETSCASSELSQWPVQIKLMPVSAPYFEGADLLVAADCTAYAYGSFHDDFMRGRITAIACPKLDGVSYSEKLSEIFSQNEIKSITLTRMQVPCCGGLENAVKTALHIAEEADGRKIPLRVVTISTDGRILDQQYF